MRVRDYANIRISNSIHGSMEIWKYDNKSRTIGKQECMNIYEKIL